MIRLLAITGGHRVDLDAFTGMLAAICRDRGWTFEHEVQPAAQQRLRRARRGAFDVIVAHDIPGLQLHRGQPPTPVGPDAETARELADLLKAGQGMVVVHHALAGWPGWPGWAEVLGGRYHYAPAELRGTAWPDSGFRYAHYTARVVDHEHPVTAGLDDFELDDELYCCPVFEADVVPLLRADAEPGPFHETYREVLGTVRDDGVWQHPPASDLIAWAKVAGRSPLVYVQPGDGPTTFAARAYRHLLANACEWVASPAAHTWAAARPTEVLLSGRPVPAGRQPN
jgi:uncharacterized protein